MDLNNGPIFYASIWLDGNIFVMSQLFVENLPKYEDTFALMLKQSLCRYRKRTDIYYSTWSLENVSESCQFQYFRHPPPQKQTLTIFWGGGCKKFF